MLTLERQLSDMRDWANAIYAHHPDEGYVKNIAAPWFEEIGPERAAQYGTLGLNELGIPGVLAQTLNCYYRWRTMESARERYERMEDVLKDSLGFAVLTGIVAGCDPKRIVGWPPELWRFSHPTAQYILIKQFHWIAQEFTGVTTSSFMMAFSMYNSTWERI